MQNFILPGFYEQFQLNANLIMLYENEIELFKENVKLECFFGTFQFCAWDGGRVFEKYNRTFKEDICYIRDFYNDRGYPLRLTFTNPEILPLHLTDPFCNLILYELNNGKNQVLATSPLLEEYIKKEYPNFKICSSTTKCLTDFKKVKQELNNKNYYQVCIDYNLNKNKKFLKSLTEIEKNKTEFLCNAICPPGCPFRKEHYRLNGLSNLNGNSPFTIECSIKTSTVDKTTYNYKNNLSPEEIIEYEKQGFSHFKLEGRTLPTSEVACNYVRYMIKPEYQIEAIHKLLSYNF